MRSKRSDFARIFLRHSLPLVIVVLIFAVAMIAITNAFVSGEVYNQANKTLYQASVYYDSITGEISALNLVFSTNNDAISSLRMVSDGMSADYDTYKEIRLITSFLTAMVSSQRFISGIYIFIPEQEGFIVSDAGLVSLMFAPERSWFENYVPSSTNATRTEVIGDGRHVRISQPIRNTVGQYAGVIAIDLDLPMLRASFKEYFRDGNMYLSVCNLEGDVLFSTLDDISLDSLEHFSYVSASNDLIYNLYIDKSELNMLLRLMIFLIVLLSFVIILIGLLISYRTDREEREFIDVLVKGLRGEGKESNAIDRGGSFYRNLTVSVLDNFIQNDYLKLQKEVSDYRALQMQINPHFLFNTIDNIYWKTIRLSGGENDASHMLTLLSSLFKASLAVDHSEGIPFGEELQHARTYMKLQEYRFHDKFSYLEQVEEGLDVKVPNMMLQPLLENAISHGMVKDRPLVIVLSVRKEDGFLLIDIFDDGKALSAEELQHLNSLDEDVLAKNHSIGLMNVRDRLRIFSKGGSELVVKSDGVRGVSVSIRIPL